MEITWAARSFGTSPRGFWAGCRTSRGLKDPAPSPNGYSTGQQQGGRLVVETNGLRDGTWLDRRDNRLTDTARLTERFRRVSYGRLEIELTIDRSKACTKPFTLRGNQLLAVDTELLDYYCQDNSKDAIHAVRK